jgi:hypothetical protein
MTTIPVYESQWSVEDLEAAPTVDGPATVPPAPGTRPRPDPKAWLKEAEADIAKAKRDLEKDMAKIAELEARCSEHRVDIKVHEARADGARRGIAELERKPRAQKGADRSQ